MTFPAQLLAAALAVAAPAPDAALAEATATQAPAPRGSAEWFRRRGAALLDAGKPREAVKAFDKALKRAPGDAELLVERAQAHSANGDDGAALRDLDAALAAAPRSTQVRNNRGILFRRIERYPDARAEFTRAIEIDPKSDIGYFNRALVWMDEYRFDSAIRDLNMSLSLAPNDPQSLMQKGEVYRLLEDYLLAADYLDAAIAADPKLGQAYVWRGAVREALGDAKGAEADRAAAEAMGLDPLP